MSLRQIASSLEISVTTVSRALGGHTDVSEATRLRIMREADRIGYVPNEMARRLQKGRADAIGFVIPGGPEAFDDSFFLKIIEGAWPRLEDQDMDLLVMSAPSGPKELKLYRRLVEGRRVDGLIITRVRDNDARINYLLDQNFPFVTISAGKFDDRRVTTIDIDNILALRLAIKRFTDLGHTTIACGGPRDLRYSAVRLDGFQRVCAELGVKGVEIVGEATIAGGQAIAAEILDHNLDVTALVCNSDRIGAGAVREVVRRGLTPGHDLSIISFGDSQMTRLTTPQLSVLRLPTEQMAVVAVDRLLQLRDGLQLGPIADQPAELILRDTDGPPRRRS
jgi:LacI family transcriptional regulator